MSKSFHLRLTHKIFVIGAIGVMGLLAFGAIYQVGSLSLDESREIAEKARTIANLTRHMSIGMLEVRRSEKDFLIRREDAYLTKHAEQAAYVSRNLNQLEAQVRSDRFSDLTARVGNIAASFNSYVTEFGQLSKAEIRLGLNETLELSGSLRNAVRAIEARLKEIDNAQLTAGMLMMRRHEKDFMLRRDPRYVDELKKAAADFAKMLAAADMPAGLKADIAAKLDTYQRDMLSWAEGSQDVKRIGAAMSRTFQAIDPVVTDLQQAVSQRLAAAEASEAATRDAIRTRMLMALVLGALLVTAISGVVGRSIARALAAITRAMTMLAAGDKTVTIPGTGRADEVGEMASAVQVFKDNMIEADRLRSEQADAEGLQAVRRRADMNKLADAFERAVGEIVETVSSASTELEASAQVLSRTAEHTESRTSAVAAASEEASTNVHSVAAASEEMSSSINEISRQVQESSRITTAAVEQIGRTDARMLQLSEVASRIGDVIELITAIAAQTNLLALNATIEAARAGEAGRGFAVVASEVKALADQTAKATGEISKQIGDIQSATQDSVVSIKEIRTTIDRVSEISATIAAAVEQQGMATQEIARNVQKAAEGTSEVASNVSEVQRGASETGSASVQVLAAAQSLSSDSSRLKMEVSNFIGSVRAA